MNEFDIIVRKLEEARDEAFVGDQAKLTNLFNLVIELAAQLSSDLNNAEGRD